MIKKYKLFESPDHVLVPNGTKLQSYFDDAYSFVVYVGKMYLSKKGINHDDNMVHINSNGNEEVLSQNRIPGVSYWDSGTNGRIWIYNDMISFWNFYGTIEEFISDITEQFQLNGINININNKWSVETYKDDYNFEIINISVFDGFVGDTTEEWIDHRDSPEEKERKIRQGIKDNRRKSKIPSWKSHMKTFESFQLNS